MRGKRYIRYYECSCSTESCPNITHRDIYAFKKWSGKCKECADKIKLVKAHLTPNPTVGPPYMALYNNLKKHAQAKNKALDLTFEEFKHFTQYDKCHYCESEIKWTKNNLTKNGSRYNLDRMDNSLGYTFSNLVPCCWRCNNGRGALFSYEEWYGMTEFLRKKSKT